MAHLQAAAERELLELHQQLCRQEEHLDQLKVSQESVVRSQWSGVSGQESVVGGQ